MFVFVASDWVFGVIKPADAVWGLRESLGGGWGLQGVCAEGVAVVGGADWSSLRAIWNLARRPKDCLPGQLSGWRQLRERPIKMESTSAGRKIAL